MKRDARGFTLIELTIVVAIISILAGVAIPQFANMLVKAQEADTKGNLGAIRTALSIYYSDTEGCYPQGALSPILTSRYLPAIPNAYLPRTPNNAGHVAVNSVFIANCRGVALIPCLIAHGVKDNGTWYYDIGLNDPTFGTIIVDCSHSDLKGQQWIYN